MERQKVSRFMVAYQLYLGAECDESFLEECWQSRWRKVEQKLWSLNLVDRRGEWQKWQKWGLVDVMTVMLTLVSPMMTLMTSGQHFFIINPKELRRHLDNHIRSTIAGNLTLWKGHFIVNIRRYCVERWQAVLLSDQVMEPRHWSPII